MNIQYPEKLKFVKNFLKQNDAKLIAHYYVDEELQKLAEDTGGCVADSLQMAKYGSQQKESKLIIAGVRFMGETAKILNPEKNIYKSLYSENTTRFAKVQIPYASKLFFQELQSMHIVPRINTK